MKVILVVDMPDIPKNCMSCPLIDYHREYSIVCRHYQTGDSRPNWCPLKPMPSKKVPAFDPNSASYNEERERSIMNEINGYNRCIDEIIGETE